MPSVLAYHRPSSLDEAVDLLSDPNRRAIGGGTVVVPDARRVRSAGIELVDLQDLGLAGVSRSEERLVVGAMTRLGDLMADDATPALLRELARRELPSTLRYQATVGGSVVLADADSVLSAGLLVHDAVITLDNGETRSLGESMAQPTTRRIVTSISLDPSGPGAVASTGRTPADEPIVAAVARRDPASGLVRLALTGVATSPVEVATSAPTAGLDPPDDFRGSRDYRLHLASVLSARVMAELDESKSPIGSEESSR